MRRAFAWQELASRDLRISRARREAGGLSASGDQRSENAVRRWRSPLFQLAIPVTSAVGSLGVRTIYLDRSDPLTFFVFFDYELLT